MKEPVPNRKLTRTWGEDRSGAVGIHPSARIVSHSLVQARAALQDVEAETGLRLADEEEDEIDTLGGLIFMLTGRVPVRGEVIPHDSGAEFEIVDADPRRIKRVRLRLPQAEAPAEPAPDAP